jgi:hypothetical protein
VADIRFSCSKCDHHMVIDEAGAGMAVTCPECGHSTTVPKLSEASAEGASGDSTPRDNKDRTVALAWVPPPSPPADPKK